MTATTTGPARQAWHRLSRVCSPVLPLVVLLFLVASRPALAAGPGPGGICTDTRCGGAAKVCCENSTALQRPDVCNGAVTCDSCCGWRADGPPAGLPTARILPLGDSITNGVGGGGYREVLGDALSTNATTAGRWSYVGLLYGNGGTHCGYSGQTIQYLNDSVALAAMDRQQPTHVMLLAGTNDFFFLHDPNQTAHGANATGGAARMRALLQTVWARRPETKVLLSGVTLINQTLCANYSQAPWHPINCPDDMQDNIVQYNKIMAAEVQSMRAAGDSRISFHDPNCLDPTDGSPGVLARACNYTGAAGGLAGDAPTFQDGDYFTWGIHFSATGYAKLAAVWAKALHNNW